MDVNNRLVGGRGSLVLVGDKVDLAGREKRERREPVVGKV